MQIGGSRICLGRGFLLAMIELALVVVLCALIGGDPFEFDDEWQTRIEIISEIAVDLVLLDLVVSPRSVA
ncbi:uncharacterized protein LAESUDRAFT_757808 [Laetiporus sulphureus 93-53]|uniref:Uncharacterized protein n=1 Tax=Laetiporus sulphureus 93-53 TaxID=1314785 RepID=A0A165F0L2_9APHY|nr:uncharacterized protein LAESUDRAFT_757808 [Laetiporus sulphureus 93-53]KZT08109.1 hypothetical protein LAESUDRAFT_757808 [Laetiporus sulphureus 93-53]